MANVPCLADALTLVKSVRTIKAWSCTFTTEFMLKEIVMLFVDEGIALLWYMFVVKNLAIFRTAPSPLPVVKFATTIVCEATDTLSCKRGDFCPTAPFSKVNENM